MAHGPDLRLDITRLSYQGSALFAGFELAVPGDQVLAVLGQSGVGKTTLLRLIAGADIVELGQVRVDNVPPHAGSRPGYVFQDARLLPWLDTAANLRAVAPDITVEQIRNLLTDVGLADQQNTFAHQLSGGMQARVALARALAVNARLLLLDEPFGSLDEATATQMRDLVQRVITARQPTVVMATHLALDAARLAHRVIVLAGRPAKIVADIDLGANPASRSADQIVEMTQIIRTAAAI